MAHFSIYIPGATGASSAHLDSVHLGELQRKTSWTWYDVTNGPDNKHGMIGTVITNRKESNALLDYKPQLQTWVPVGNRPDLGLERGAFWYGYETERPPGPRDLVYDRIVRGKDVRLLDDNVWHVPESLKLPMDIGRDAETGELTKLYSDEYREFCEHAERYVFVFFENIINLEVIKHERPDIPHDEVNAEFEMEESWQFCARALSINYRVAEPIIGPDMLHLFDDRRMAYVIMGALAFPDILEVIEKKKITSPVTIPVGLTMSAGELTRRDHRRGSTCTS